MTENSATLKEKIIHESLKLFSLKGFLNTSTHDIMREAKTSKGGLYNHFKSKDDIFSAVLSEARKIWRQRNLYGLDRIAKPVAKVKKLLLNYRDLYLKDRENFPGGCIFVSLSVEMDDQKSHFSKELNEGFVRLKAMIKRLLDQGKKSGELRKDVNTASVTEMIFSGMLGASVIYGTEKSDAGLNRCINALIDYLDSLAP
ncbi:MAG TPA: TetR/AcrR family transcriptional regulator [Syntrophales bacterium]|nr:TetR/AcrR family transcriptional regulator [Syntrophales bacterium]